MISIVIPAKDERSTLKRCLIAIEKIRKKHPLECIVVGDRTSIEITSDHPWAKGILYNGDMESAIETGIKHASSELILKMDADIILPRNFFEVMLPYTETYDLVSCPASTRSGKLWLDFFFSIRDLLLKIAPMGRSTHGNSMLFRKTLIKEIGGFRYDTALEKEVLNRKGKIKVADEIRVLEYREDFNVKRIIKKQIEAGMKRRRLGLSFLRTLAHSLFRGRIFVIIGWLRG